MLSIIRTALMILIIVEILRILTLQISRNDNIKVIIKNIKLVLLIYTLIFITIVSLGTALNLSLSSNPDNLTYDESDIDNVKTYKLINPNEYNSTGNSLNLDLDGKLKYTIEECGKQMTYYKVSINNCYISKSEMNTLTMVKAQFKNRYIKFFIGKPSDISTKYYFNIKNGGFNH